MVFDGSKKFLIFKKIKFLVIFSRKIGKNSKKHPDRAGKENVVLTGRSTGRSGILYRTGSTGYRYRLQLCLVIHWFWFLYGTNHIHINGTRCDEPKPTNLIVAHVERRPLIEDNESSVLFSVTICSLILNPRSTSEFPCEMMRRFLTILDTVGYFGNPTRNLNDNALFQ